MTTPRIIACVGAALAGLLLAGSALAGGGGSIKSAPTVQYGAQTFGNTASPPTIDGQTTEWWMLPLIAGDHLTIKFENSSSDTGTIQALIYPAGTDDFNLSDTNQLLYVNMNDNAHAEIDFDAPKTAAFPLAFRGCPNCSGVTAGAYDFTATVTHVARLAWTVGTVKRTGSVVLQAHFPDGQVIKSGLGGTLYGYWTGSWHKLGQSAVVNGVLKIRYQLPPSEKGQRVKLQVAAGGASFKGVKLTRRVLVD